jgi:hypothetical protein
VDEETAFLVAEAHDASFIRGDANDDGNFDVSDPVAVLTFLFRGGSAPYCADAADANDSGDVDISDSILMLTSLFLGESGVVAPYPERGFDATADELSCGG